MHLICSSCKPCLPCVSCIEKVKSQLTHGCDGPITDFVIISRGCRIAVKGEFSSEVVANAITESLQEYGFLSQENPVLMTGS